MPPRDAPSRERWQSLGHPGLVAAVGILALNDHVLKDAFPGIVTGKLSDVAGLVVVAWLLSVALGGRRGVRSQAQPSWPSRRHREWRTSRHTSSVA